MDEKWGTATANRGELVGLSHTTSYKKWGKYGYGVTFDFTKAQRGTVLGAYVGPKEATHIGDAVAIGVWIYGTKEAQGYWLRMSLIDGNNQCKVLNLTDEKRGIDWVGWRYIIVDIPLWFQKPLTVFPNQFIRLMSIRGGEETGGPMTKGKFYIGGVMFYLEKIEMPKPPIITCIEIEEQVEDIEQVNINIVFKQYSNTNENSPINRLKVKIDGIRLNIVPDKCMLTNEGIRIIDVVLVKGDHRIEVGIEDAFGNQARKEIAYEKLSGKAIDFTMVYPEEITGCGEGSIIRLKGKGATVALKIVINPIQMIEDIKFSNTIEGSWHQEDEAILIKYTGKYEEAKALEDIATIQLKAPARGMEEVVIGPIQYIQKEALGVWTQTFKAQTLPITYPYILHLDSCIQGIATTIRVVEHNQQPVKDVKIVLKQKGKETIVGYTDGEGILESSQVTHDEGEIYLWGAKDKLCTKEVCTYVHKPLLTSAPTYAMLHVGQREDIQVVTWMTSVQKQGSSQLYIISENPKRLVKATSKIVTFTSAKDNGDNGAVAIYQAVIEGLVPGVSYKYQIGSEKVWNDSYSLKYTHQEPKMTEFIVLGDMQSEDMALFSRVLHAVEKHAKNLRFIAQLGDLVDEATNFGQLKKIMETIINTKVCNLPWLHLLGNHEFMGDRRGQRAKHYLAIPYKNKTEQDYGCYSIDYPHVHIAVISYVHEDKALQKVAEWLEKDMTQSQQTWKILLTHQPPYYTNPDGGNEAFKKVFVPLIDKLEIDVVFSGHDHAYGRTFKLRHNKVSANGTVYMVCGTVGGKYYEAKNDGCFEVYNDTHEPLYIKVTLTETILQIDALRVEGGLVDRVRIYKEKRVY